VEDVIPGGSAREITARALKALNDRTDGGSAGKSLHQLVGDVPRIQCWEDEHVRPPRDRTAGSFARPDFADERGITLQFSVHDKTWRALAQLGQCVHHQPDSCTIGAPLGAEGKNGTTSHRG